MNEPKVLIVGLDAATFDLIGPWLAEGKLPNLEALMKNGAWGRLASILPPITPPAWTSFMTGKNPGKHGIFHFMEAQPGTYGLRYLNAASRRAKNRLAHAVGSRLHRRHDEHSVYVSSRTAKRLPNLWNGHAIGEESLYLPV
jgi:predicted AlkP superfamily phosphohydrolase/phosphomutase